MTALLLVSGVALHFVTRRAGLESIDRELIDRSLRAHGFAPRPMREPMNRPNPPMPPPPDRMRPRLFTLDGRPIGNNTDSPFDAEALRSSLPRWSTPTVDGENFRVLTFAINAPNGPIVGQVGRSLEDFERLLRVQALTLLWMAPLAILVSAVAGAFLARRAIEPIEAVTNAARAIDDAHLDMRIPVKGDDELARLGETFNGMVDRLEASFGRVNAALEDQKRFVADASHELKTPLARARLATSAALSQDLSREELTSALRVADQGIASVTHLVHQLLDLARQERSAVSGERIDLVECVREATTKQPDPVQLQVQVPAQPVWINADPLPLQRAIENLIENALLHGQPPVGVRLQSVDADAVLVVRDHGQGVADDHLPHLGKRFFRPDDSRTVDTGGAGLGLAIVKATVERLGGKFEVRNEPDGGLSVSLIIPLSD
jgi:signal transduction histidine kinase